MAGSNTGLAWLPDCILEHIVSLTTRSEGDEKFGRDALPFVCRDFYRIYRSSRLLWGALELAVDHNASDEKVAGLLPSLRHRGAVVTRLLARLLSDKVALPEFMAHFSTDCLRELELDLGGLGTGITLLPAGQLSCLSRLTRLQSLKVFHSSVFPLVDDLSWLCALPGLHELGFATVFGSTVASASISRLTALSYLKLGIFPADAQLSGALARLSRLRCLDLVLTAVDQQQLGAACFSHLQQLTQLLVMRFPGATGSLQLGGLSTMPRLQQLLIKFNFDLDLQGLLRCSQLSYLSLWGVGPEPFAALEGGRLPQGSLPALTSLEWHPDPLYLAEFDEDEEADVDFPEGLCKLIQLQELRVKLERRIEGVGHVQARVSLPAAFSQFRDLRRLEISRLGLRELPAAIAGLSKLECLDLSRNWLSAKNIPPGPYLDNLRWLNLHGNRLQRIPEALASATKLEALDVSYNVSYIQFNTDQLALLPGRGVRRLYITKRLMYCPPPQGAGVDYAAPLWTRATLEAIRQVQIRFPSVAIFTDKYMQEEEWWQGEWASEG